MSEEVEPIIIEYSGAPFSPPGWDSPHNPHYPVPEPSTYGFIMSLFFIAIFLIKRQHRVYNKEIE